LRILCLGDVVGPPGRDLLAKSLMAFRHERSIDFVVANVENATDGSGVSLASFKSLRAAGIDVCTTGDHVYKRADVLKCFEREPDRLLRPANYPRDAAGKGVTTVTSDKGVPVSVLNLQGRVFMDPADDPFRVATELLAGIRSKIVILDFHAEATSEKRAMGWYLDGKVSAVVGTHTHVPTADEEILQHGTAYVSDLGMSGPYRSVIGRTTANVLKSFTTRMYAPFTVAEHDVRAHGVLLEVDESSGRARSIERIVLRED
jgi:metallophosphoesterase (TIGR00282 family)